MMSVNPTRPPYRLLRAIGRLQVLPHRHALRAIGRPLVGATIDPWRNNRLMAFIIAREHNSIDRIHEVLSTSDVKHGDRRRRSEQRCQSLVAPTSDRFTDYGNPLILLTSTVVAMWVQI